MFVNVTLELNVDYMNKMKVLCKTYVSLLYRQKDEQIKKEKLRRKEAEVQCHVSLFQSYSVLV